jgi:predicted ABC-type transport system involved in lysophospholipase L1 biosynthesis ATPase subunit
LTDPSVPATKSSWRNDGDVVPRDQAAPVPPQPDGERIMAMLTEINEKNGTTILLVTHEPDDAAIAGRQFHMVDGIIDSDRERKKSRGRR